MKIGYIFPQFELAGDPTALGVLGRAADTLGYDHMMMFDHVAGADHANRTPPLTGPFTYQHPFHEPFVAISYLMGMTKRIAFATGVVILPQRQTVLVARQAADIDLLSGGRLRLGAGVGWNPVEFAALGQDFHTRGKRLDEQIVLLRKLWQDSPVSFDGRFDKVDRAGINPRPNRLIPIWGGGATEAAYKRAARLADGFIFSGAAHETALRGWKKIKEMVADEGRSVADFGGEYLVPPGVKPAAALDLIKLWQDMGGTHASVSTLGHGFTAPAQHADYLAKVRALLK
jgi:probable F420-dependent oxidoreductase